jgi:IS5 family transposase
MSIKTTRQRKNRICARQGKHHLFKNRPAEEAVALLRDVMRKLPESSRAVRQEELDRYRKAVNQECQDTNKIYSLHEPEVCCVSKGKEHKKYKFGSKAASVMTKTNCIVVGAKGFRNEYDGDMFKGVLEYFNFETLYIHMN